MSGKVVELVERTDRAAHADAVQTLREFLAAIDDGSQTPPTAFVLCYEMGRPGEDPKTSMVAAGHMSSYEMVGLLEDCKLEILR